MARSLGVTAKSVLPADKSAVLMLTDKQASEFRMRSDVVDIEKDVPVKVNFVPDDPSVGQLYGLQVIKAHQAWDTTIGDASSVVGIIDTGIALNHLDLQPNIFRNSGEIAGNGIDDDGNGFVDDVTGYDFAENDEDPTDGNGHGTHCSGVVAAVGNNGEGVVGVAHGSRIIPLKALGADGSGFFSDVARAIDYAVLMKDRGHPIRVLSLSLGGSYSAVVDRSIQRAATRGVLIIAAAGNETSNIDKNPQYPASFTYNNIVAVAAVDSSSSIASFSNFGRKSVDISAPGVGILSTFPYTLRQGTGYAELSGTSMATPHVAGVASLILSVNPSLTMSQVRNLLLSSVTPEPSLASLTATGGVLNAEAAVQAAIGLAPAKVISGQVVQKRNRALRGATVTLVSANKTYRQSVTSDFAGDFVFDDVTDGDYTLSVKKKNFSCRKPNRINVSGPVTVAEIFSCVPRKVAR